MKNFQLMIQILISVFIALFFVIAILNGNTSAEESNSEYINNQLVDEIKEKITVPMNSDDVSELRPNNSINHTPLDLDTILEQQNADDISLIAENEIGEIARLRQELIKLELEHQKVVLESKIAEVVNSDLMNNDADETEPIIASLIEELEELKSKQTDSMNDFQSLDPLPVVAEIVGVTGQLEAKLLVPYFGEITAKVGMILPNGMKVSSISPTSVMVSIDEESQMLPFGTSVPATRKTDNIDNRRIEAQ